MQNYGQTPGYQQPGSAAGFAGQQGGPTPAPPPPQPGYGGMRVQVEAAKRFLES